MGKANTVAVTERKRVRRHPWQRVATQYAFPKWKRTHTDTAHQLEQDWRQRHPENTEP